MSSQFKRKKTGVSRDKSRDNSTILTGKRMASNQTLDYRTEMRDIEKDNANILGSLVVEEEEDKKTNDIAKRVEMSQKLTNNRESKIGLGLKSDIKPTTQNDKKETEQIENKQKSVLDQNNDKIINNESETQMNKINENSKPEPEHQSDSKSSNQEDDAPQQKQYGEDPEIALLILTLKNHIKNTDEENSKLKKKNLEFSIREHEYQQRIKELAMKSEELELEQKLLNERPSEHIKFDLEDLDSRLKVMDDNLQKATGENSQEKFLEEIIARNKEFNNKNMSNSAAMKKLRENLANLRSTLLGITTK